MNRKQRDANRRTTREAQAALAAQKRGIWPWQERALTLASLTDGARKVVFCMKPEQDPPVLVEGESDLTKVMGHFTRGATSGPVFFCVDDLDCSAPAAVEKAPEFATALDRIWVSQSVLSPIRYIDEPAKEAT